MGLLSMMEGSAPPQQAIQNDDAAKQAAQTEKQSNKVDYDVVYRDVKQRVHSSVIENFNTSGVTSVDPEAMKKFLLEAMTNTAFRAATESRLRRKCIMIFSATVLFKNLSTAMIILKLWLTDLIKYMSSIKVNLSSRILNSATRSTL